ncbi:hypothetical protein ATK86_5525 [Nocardia fluminea]|uniref:Uncharacterized protein n=2 Tax=Nocardia fluminea TaxID=134984 RepID=A0A2N3VHG3_9NOCA|nr:hypothetical protein ATK86_5525 [Nocardia fluminea]
MWRIVDPPVPVTVDIGAAIVTRAAHFGVNKVRLGIRHGGLSLTGTTPGFLRAWARVADDTWLGLVAFTLATSNGHGRLHVEQWCPQHALSQQNRSGQ